VFGVLRFSGTSVPLKRDTPQNQTISRWERLVQNGFFHFYATYGVIAPVFLSQVSFPPEVDPPLAEKRFRRRLRIVYRDGFAVYRAKTKDETDLKTQTSCLRNRYLTETQTDPMDPVGKR